ncbi:KPNB1 [Symbiodinium sp. CCMP2456]|nr:KPNB1 [Symbiodinium sp. CCMP2456]
MAVLGNLLHCLSTDAQAREAAEQQLLEHQQRDPAGFAASCAATMCDGSQPPQARQLAALLLKNTLPVPGVEGSLQGPVLQALADSSDAALRRGAALCAAKLACSNFAAVAPQLLALCRRPDVTPELLSCFGQIAEHWQCSGAGLLPGSAELMKATLSFLSLTKPAPLRGAAAEALSLLVPVSLGATKEAAGEVLAATLAAGTGEAELRLLGVAACECYEALGTPQLQQMIDLCRGALRGTGEASQVQAVELWETLAAYELYLLDGKPSGQCRGLLQQALPNLMPLLLEALQARPSTWQSGSWDPEEDASPVQEAACGAVITVAKVTGDACVGPILQFASAAMSSQDEWQRRSALLAFGALQDGPSTQALRPFVASALPNLLEALRSHPVPEASAAAWTLGRVLDKNPGSVADEAQAVLFDAALRRLRAEAALAEELCYCLDGLVDQQAAVLEPVPFGAVLESLLAATQRALPQSRTQHALLSCLTELLGRASEECLPQMESLLDEVLKQAELEQVGGAAARGLFCCLRVLIVRLGPRVQSRSSAVSSLLARHGAAGEEEAIRAMGHLAAALGANFEGTQLWPALLASIRRPDIPEACHASLAALGDVAKALGAAFAPAAAAAVASLAPLLTGGNLPNALRATRCLGAIFQAMGGATPHLEELLTALQSLAGPALQDLGDGPGGSDAAAPSSLGRCYARQGPQPRLPRSHHALLGEGSRGKERDPKRDFLEAVLFAIEALVVSCQQQGGVPPAVQCIVAFAITMLPTLGTGPPVLRSGLRLVGRLAEEATGVLRRLLLERPTVQDHLQKLLVLGGSSPNTSVRNEASKIQKFLSG